MTDATLSPDDAAVTAPQAASAGAAAPAIRPARLSDIRLVHPRLMEAIRTSPYYSQTFKDFECERLTPAYLEALIDADPYHVAIMVQNGEECGFMISGPEFGTLWLYWSYVFPEKRRSGIALKAMRAFLDHWDHGRFHKVATYTKHGNEVAAAIMNRFGFVHTVTIEQHMFGEDYLLFERRLEKTVPSYDRGVALGRLAQLKRRIRRALRPASA